MIKNNSYKIIDMTYNSIEYRTYKIEEYYKLFLMLCNKFGGQILYKNPGLIGMYSGGKMYYFYIIKELLPEKIFLSEILLTLTIDNFEKMFGDRTQFRISYKDREIIQKMIDEGNRKRYIELGNDFKK